MATKVFLKWLGEGCKSLTTGREYEHIQDDFPYVVSNVGESLCTDGKQSCWPRIEREVFTAHNLTWFAHTPGEPMPCDEDRIVSVLMECEVDGIYVHQSKQAGIWDWQKTGGLGKVGWRYAEPTKSGGLTSWGAKDFSFTPGIGEALCDEFEMHQADIAAIEDGHLTTGQKRHWDEQEAKQAAREQLQRDADAKALQERADGLAEAGRAMDRVQTSHGHRLGWSRG